MSTEHEAIPVDPLKMHGIAWRAVANAAALAALVITAQNVADQKVVRQVDTNQLWVPLTVGAGAVYSPLGTALRESGGTNLSYGAIADGQVLIRSGTTVIGATPIVGPADPGDNGKIPRASGGNFVYISSTPNFALVWNGATWAGQAIVDNNIDAAAAIAGTKISPNFGSQAVTSTGNFTASTSKFISTGAAGGFYHKDASAIIQLGLDAGSGNGTAAATGNVRGSRAFAINAIASDNTTDVALFVWSAAGTSLTIGQTTGCSILYQASATHIFGIAGTEKFRVAATTVVPSVQIVFNAATGAPGMTMSDKPSAGTAASMVVTGQNTTNAGTTVAGDVLITGGSGTSAGAVTSQTAGSVWLSPGSVNASSGVIVRASAGIKGSSGAKVIEVLDVVSSQALGFFAATPVVKQSLTNGTTGVAANNLVDSTGTGVGTPDAAKINANFASIWTKVNNYGLWA